MSQLPAEWYPEPGIYKGVSWAEYKSCPYMNPSTLKKGLRSMRHLKRAIDGELQPSAKTVAVGQAVHCLVADETDRLAVMPDFEKDPRNLTAGTVKEPPKAMTKKDGSLSAAGQKWQDLCSEHGLPVDHCGEIRTGQKPTESKVTDFYKTSVSNFVEQNEGKTLLTEIEMNVAKKVIGCIYENSKAAEIIRRSEHELTVIAEIEGVMCKTRIDGAIAKDRNVWDLKTTDDISGRTFYRQCKKLGHLFQFGFHQLACANAGKNAFAIERYDAIAAEVSGDYDTGVILIPPQLLDDWAEKVSRVLNDYKLAKSTDIWPGLYPAGIGLLDVPDYDMAENGVFQG